jgi:EpsI family protein
MIAFNNAVLPDTGSPWAALSRIDRSIQVDGGSLPIREWRVRAGSEQRLLWSWYTVGGVHATGDYQAKALTVQSMLLGRGDHSTVSVLGTRLDGLTPTSSPGELEQALVDARVAALKASSERVTRP